MNWEMYRDATAERAVERADRDLQRARRERVRRMRESGMVYVLIPSLEEAEGEAAREQRRPIMNYIVHRGRIPCWNEKQQFSSDPEIDEMLYRARSACLLEACREVWIFGSSSGEYTRNTKEVIRQARVAGKTVRSFYLDALRKKAGGMHLKAQMKPITVTVTDAKYATFIAPKDVTTDGSNTTAYKVTKLHDGWVTMEEVAEVPAGAAVVVGADEAGTYTLKRNAAAALDGNILTYSADPISVATAKTYYGLSKGSKGTGFYPVKKGATIAANKPYFLNEDAGAKDFYSLFEDPTGIEGVIIEKLDGTQEIYNVRGQRLNKLERGINIVNGKKVILK